MFSPLEQFQINNLWKLYITSETIDVLVWIDSLGWSFILIVISIVYFILIPLKYSFIVTRPILYIHEFIFKFLLGLFKTINNSYAIRFFPLIAVLFYFILFANLLGLLPYGFTVTSQLYVTFTLAISVFIGITILGMVINKFNFVKFFIPSNVSNKPLRFFLVFIEILSYIIRPFSLGIRLFANMLAGHTLIYILANFAYSIGLNFFFLTLLVPFLVIFLIMILEFCIAIIQTYVFTVLTIIYIKDMFNMVH